MRSKATAHRPTPTTPLGPTRQPLALSADGQIENVYVSGIVSKVSIDTNYGNATYYISEDGTTTSEQFEVYRGYYLNGEKFTSTDQLKVGQKVTVKGTLINYMGNTPEMTKGDSIVSIDGSGTTPDTPVTNEGITISGTTVTLTNSGLTAGTTTATVDLSTLGYDNAAEVTTVQLSDGATVTFAANGEQNGRSITMPPRACASIRTTPSPLMAKPISPRLCLNATLTMAPTTWATLPQP